MDTTYASSRRSFLVRAIGVLAALLLAVGVTLVGCGPSGGDSAQSASEPTPTETSEKEGVPIDVTVVISSTVPDHEISSEQTVTLTENANAYDALIATGADVTGDGGFVKSIDGLENGAAGSMSGWTYLVNGEQPTMGATQYELVAGDTVEWTFYTGE